MAPMYFEDFNIGDKFVTPGKTITEAAITQFVGLGGYIMPFFLDEEFAKTTVFGTRIAPGRFTLFMMGGLEEQTGIFDETLIALVNISNVSFRAPVRAGDTIRVEMEITGKRETSKPDRGVITHKSLCRNQRGEVVVETESSHLFKRKGHG